MDNDPRVPKYLDIDAARFISVVMNLVCNSIKFTNKGYVEISTQ